MKVLYVKVESNNLFFHSTKTNKIQTMMNYAGDTISTYINNQITIWL